MYKLFYPQSMVIIGVSLQKMSLGKIALLNNVQRGWKGTLYGIGNEEGALEGVSVYTEVQKIPEIPDVAVILTPVKTVPGFVRDCGVKGIPFVVIETGGFSEYSSDTSSIEQEILEIARKYRIRLVGPNCVGVANAETGMMQAFSFFKREVGDSSVSVISQSGGIGNTFMRILIDNHIFYRKFAAVGNKLDFDEVDFLRYFLGDDKTNTLLLYLESFKRGRDFFDCVMSSEKPVIMLKSNRNPLSARIAQSHTSALSAGDDVVDAMLDQAAVTRVESEDDVAVAVKAFHLPAMKGNRVAVLSRSGGHAVLTADACVKYGFDLIPYPDFYMERLSAIYQSRYITRQNPLDLGEIFEYTVFIKILEETLKLDVVDGVIFNHLYQSSYEAQSSRAFLDSVMDLMKKYRKPIAVSLTSDAEEILSISKHHPLPTFGTPLQAAAALRYLCSYHVRKIRRDSRGTAPEFDIDADFIRSVKDCCEKEGRIPLTDEALKICSAAGITIVKQIPILTADDLKGLDIAYPVVVKLLSRDASHKSDIGGVKLNIRNRRDARKAVDEIIKTVSAMEKPPRIDGFLIQEMVPPGEEFFVGARQDPSFGPIVMAGLGGVFVEIFMDTAIRIAPVTRNDARDMLKQLKSYPIIRGTRGSAPLDEEALVDLMCRMSYLLHAVDCINEIDLNPVIVHPKGRGVSVSIVDSRVFFR